MVFKARESVVEKKRLRKNLLLPDDEVFDNF